MDSANVARAYEVYRATPWITALSVLTDEDHFGGDVEELARAREAVPEKPILRKDFIVDRYQILEARACGADAVLLMAALHAENPGRLAELFAFTRQLGMRALVEIGMGGGDTLELPKIIPPDAIIRGINSRRFEGSVEAAKAGAGILERTGRDPLTSLDLHKSLRNLIPADKIAVAESGFHNAADLQAARDAGYNAALIGTAFLKAPGGLDNAIRDFGGFFDVTPAANRAATAAE